MMRCESCDGKKRIIALGNLIKDCINCKGIGWTEPKAKKEVMDFPHPKKKPGRKHKPETILHI